MKAKYLAELLATLPRDADVVVNSPLCEVDGRKNDQVDGVMVIVDLEGVETVQLMVSL